MEEDRQQIEEQGAVVVGFDGQQLPPPLALGAGMDHLEVRRFPRETGAVVDDLDRQFALGVVELHAVPGSRHPPGVTLPGESVPKNTGGWRASRMAAPVGPKTTEGALFSVGARTRIMGLGSTGGTRGWRR